MNEVKIDAKMPRYMYGTSRHLLVEFVCQDGEVLVDEKGDC